jgi:hypothetical protein
MILWWKRRLKSMLTTSQTHGIMEKSGQQGDIFSAKGGQGHPISNDWKILFGEHG